MQRAWNVRLKTKRVSSSKIVSSKGLTLTGSRRREKEPGLRRHTSHSRGDDKRDVVGNKGCGEQAMHSGLLQPTKFLVEHTRTR